MGDWGKVIFLYDYEYDYKLEFWREDSEISREKTQGIIVKTYRHHGIDGIVQHAYYGMRYFMERFTQLNLGLSEYRCYRGDLMGVDLSNLTEINTAFDIFMDQGKIALGYNPVKDVIRNWGRNKKKYEEKPSELKDDLFGGDESDGVFYIYYSGNPDNGYTLQYAYKLGTEILDIQHVFKNALDGESVYKNNKEEIDKAIKFFEENGTLITSEKDLKFIENRGASLVQQALEDN